MSSEPKYKTVTIKLSSSKPPVFIEKNDKDYIFFGENNDYPNYLIELYRRSVMHSTIIDGKIKLVCGQGWEIDGYGLTALEKAQSAQWIKKPNGKEDLLELTRKVVTDLELFDGFYLQPIRSKAGNNITWHHVPFQDVRISKEGDYLYSTKWRVQKNGKWVANRNIAPEDIVVLKPYDADDKSTNQLLAYKCYSPGLDVYPLPNYLSAITAIETEARIDNFWLNFIKNGFSAAHIINFYNGLPTPEEQDQIEEDIVEKFTGDDTAGRFVLNFSIDKEHGSEVITVTPSDFDKQFAALKDTVQQNILTRHNISNPALVGIKTPGQLGNRNELSEAYELYQKWYVAPRQKIVEYVFNELINHEKEGVRIKIKPLQPIGIDMTSDNVWAILTMDEKREVVGLPKLTKPLAVTSSTESKFSADWQEAPESFADVFSKYGFSKSEVETIETKEFEFESEEQIEVSENLFRETFAKKDDDTTIGDIGKINLPKVETKVVYSYEGAQDSRNRAFCKKMLQLNRYYTKEDMRLINAEIRSNDEYRDAFGDLEINVWKHRGGWYRKPNTDVSIPRCRHTWKQSLIISKR